MDPAPSEFLVQEFKRRKLVLPTVQSSKGKIPADYKPLFDNQPSGTPRGESDDLRADSATLWSEPNGRIQSITIDAATSSHPQDTGIRTSQSMNRKCSTTQGLYTNFRLSNRSLLDPIAPQIKSSVDLARAVSREKLKKTTALLDKIEYLCSSPSAGATLMEQQRTSACHSKPLRNNEDDAGSDKRNEDRTSNSKRGRSKLSPQPAKLLPVKSAPKKSKKVWDVCFRVYAF